MPLPTKSQEIISHQQCQKKGNKHMHKQVNGWNLNKSSSLRLFRPRNTNMACTHMEVYISNKIKVIDSVIHREAKQQEEFKDIGYESPCEAGEGLGAHKQDETGGEN